MIMGSDSLLLPILVYMAFSGPTPPFNNPPIHPEYYSPKVFVISGITLGLTTIITTVLPMDYVLNQEVRILIPPDCGTRQLNENLYRVISMPSANQVELDVQSTYFDSFVSPVGRDLPQIVAVGDYNTGQINANGRRFQKTFIPGSFINISPK